jgi:hypothetical protein
MRRVGSYRMPHRQASENRRVALIWSRTAGSADGGIQQGCTYLRRYAQVWGMRIDTLGETQNIRANKS